MKREVTCLSGTVSDILFGQYKSDKDKCSSDI